MKKIISIGLLVLTGCISRNENEYFLFKDALFETINIEFKDEILISDYFTEIDYIILESIDSVYSSLIGEVYKISVDQNRVLIFDKRLTQNIFIYDSTGKYLNTISNKGKGPGEYTFPWNLHLSDNYIELFDAGSYKMISYNLDGQYIKENYFSFYVEEFMRFDNKLIFTSSTNSSKLLPEKENSNVLYITDSTATSVIESYFPYHSLEDYIDPGLIFSHQDTISFVRPYYGRVYSISKNAKLQPRYLFDFGDYQMTREMASAFNEQELVKKFINGEIALGIFNMVENDQHIVFQFYLGKGGNENPQNTYFGILNKATNTCYATNKLVNDIDQIPIEFPISKTTEGHLLGFIQPENIPEGTVNRFQNLNENSNPVLCILR